MKREGRASPEDDGNDDSGHRNADTGEHDRANDVGEQRQERPRVALDIADAVDRQLGRIAVQRDVGVVQPIPRLEEAKESVIRARETDARSDAGCERESEQQDARCQDARSDEAAEQDHPCGHSATAKRQAR